MGDKEFVVFVEKVRYRRKQQIVRDLIDKKKLRVQINNKKIFYQAKFKLLNDQKITQKKKPNNFFTFIFYRTQQVANGYQR